MLDAVLLWLLFVAILLPVPHLWPSTRGDQADDWGRLDRW